MPSFEWNKIIASVLTAVIVAMVAGLLSQELFQREIPSKPVYMVEGAQQVATAAAQPAAPTLEPIGPLLAKADIKKGQELSKVCAVCHTFAKDEPNKIGPNLWNVVGAPIAEDRGGFSFSAALDKHHGQKWTPQLLNEWLHDPQHFAQGTKMTFAGFPKAQDRADVIAYLATLGPGGVAAEQALAKKLAAEAAQQKPVAANKPAPAAPAAPSMTAMLSNADAKKGKELTQICAVCHTFDKGGENKIGPNLWNVVGAPIAQDRNNYPFSSALEKHKGQKWTPELLNEWLDNPQHFAQGTKMTFAGFPKAQNRADVIKYLETLK